MFKLKSKASAQLVYLAAIITVLFVLTSLVMGCSKAKMEVVNTPPPKPVVVGPAAPPQCANGGYIYRVGCRVITVCNQPPKPPKPPKHPKPPKPPCKHDNDHDRK